MIRMSNTDVELKKDATKTTFPAIHSIRLPFWEIATLALVFLLMVGKSWYEVYRFSHKPGTIFEFQQLGMLRPSYFKQFVDVSEGQWTQFKHMAYHGGPLALSYLIVSMITRRLGNNCVFSTVCSVCSLLILTSVLSVHSVVAFCAVSALFLVVGALRQKVLMWVLAVAAFMLMEWESFQWIIGMTGSDRVRHMMLYAGFALHICRLINVVGAISSAPERPISMWLGAVHFLFYPITFFSGPLGHFSDFYQQISTPCHTLSVRNLITRVIRLTTWWLLCDGLLHLFFFNAIFHSGNLEYINRWAMLGAMYLCGKYFYLIYVQVYGWPFVLTSIDGFKFSDWPDCITHIYLYSEMWRVFDRGLAIFLKWNIYIPMGGNRAGTLMKIASTILSFGFVLVYHGITVNNSLWIAMNMVQILLEQVVFFVFHKTTLGNFIQENVSAGNIRRFAAFLGSQSLLFSISAFFMFFVGHESGIRILQRIFDGEEDYHVCYLLTSIAFYATVQLSLEAKNVREKKKTI